jgi:hypothetical protein
MVTQPTSTPSRALQNIKNRLDDLKTPAELQTRVADHIAHLQKLAQTLQSFGLDETTIDRQVIELFESYEQQLLLVMSSPASGDGGKGVLPC